MRRLRALLTVLGVAAQHMPEERMLSLVPEVAATAEAISRSLGWRATHIAIGVFTGGEAEGQVSHAPNGTHRGLVMYPRGSR